MSSADTMEPKTKTSPSTDPSKIMQIGMGFWASTAMLGAVRFEVFTLLAAGSKTGKQIKEQLGLKTTDRHIYDWLDVLTSFGFLERQGVEDNAVYSNAADTDAFLDKKKSSYIGGILEMANNRLYQFWGNLEEGLLTGKPQNESKAADDNDNMEFFSELYKEPVKLQEFMNAMSGIQMGNFMTLVNKFDFSQYKTLLDVGGADGWLSIQICRRHPNINCINFDLPPVEPLAKKKIEQFGLSDRIKVVAGDFMKDEFPAAEIIVMGNILHGMNEEAKISMLEKVYARLPQGGAFVVIENIIDNERRQNTFGLLMSLNMLIENGDAFDMSFNDFQNFAKKAGFSRSELMPLTGPTSAVIAYK